MADQIVNTIKPILLDELTKKIKDNKDKFDVVEAGIDDIIKKVKEVVEPISSPIVAGMKLIPFGNPSERLQELADDLKLKMDGIDLSELEKIPDLSPEITIRVKALPQKVKDKLKTLVDELVSGTPTAAEPTTTATAEPTTTATVADAVAEKSIEDGLSNLTNDDKKETIDEIMLMLQKTGILDEIKKRLCTPAAILPNETEQKVVDNNVESGQEAAEKAKAEEATKKAKAKQEEAEEATKKAKAKQEEAEEATKKAKAEQEEAEEATKEAKAKQEALEKEIEDAEDKKNALEKEIKDAEDKNALEKEIKDAEDKKKTASSAANVAEDELAKQNSTLPPTPVDANIPPVDANIPPVDANIPPVDANIPPTPPVGGSNKKHRRKTKKNIHRQKRTYTKFGRNF